jgi:beta-lactamase regulating signal transducer with metallopeptidase domain
MNNLLLFLLKSTISISLLYLLFRMLMREESFFKLSRLTLLFIVLASTIIPFITLPQPIYPVLPITITPIFKANTVLEEPVQTNVIPSATYSSESDPEKLQPIVISTKTILLIVYLGGVLISFLLLVYRISSVLQLFRNSKNTVMNGINLMIVNDDIPAFSFKRYILISQNDYETNSEAILTHELSHIRQGHFYDLMLLELVKIVYWFNPLVYHIDSDLKEIHEFQADEHTLNSGIDATKYQLLIIQKCVGHRQFALANSFNHCQIKNRITMMNKSKTNKAACWKVATFLPLLALLLMAFGKRDEIVPEKINLSEKISTPAVVGQQQNEQFKQKIEIKKDGNYIDNKLCSLEEIAKKGKEWSNANTDWIYLLIDESIPLIRVDEVRETLGHSNGIVQTTVGSNELVYFAGDVSAEAKFTKGKYDDWLSEQLNNYPQIKSLGEESIKNFPARDDHPAFKGKVRNHSITYSFVIGKDGKVRNAHIIKGSGYTEIDAAYEKILSQMPDWEPAKRGRENVSVYNHIMGDAAYFLTE